MINLYSMKKIFSLPSIGRKTSEFYSDEANDFNINDFTSLSNLSDEKRLKLEKLQNKLNCLYDELDKVLIKEEELVNLNYRGKKRKIEPISNFESSFLNTLKENKLSKHLSDSVLNKSNLKNEIKEDLNNNQNKNIFKLKNDDDISSNNFSSKFYCSLKTLSDLNENNEGFDNFNMQNKKVLQKDDNFSLKSNKDLSSQNNGNLSLKSSNSFIVKDNIELNNDNTDGSKSRVKNISKKKVSLKTSKVSHKLNEKKTNVKFSNLRKRIQSILMENNELRQELINAFEKEKQMKIICSEMENQISHQKKKIQNIEYKLIESNNKYEESKSEYENFKIEMLVEREKFVKFTFEEQKNNESLLKKKLKEKDDLVNSLNNELNELKLKLLKKNSENGVVINYLNENKLEFSEKIDTELAIEDISIYKNNSVTEIMMINLKDSDVCDNEMKGNFFLKNYFSDNLNDDSLIYQMDNSLDKFKIQMNILQKEYYLIANNEERQKFLLKIEDFILKNMRKLVVDKLEEIFDNIQVFLAQLKLEIIYFATENEFGLKTNDYSLKSKKLINSIEWFNKINSALLINKSKSIYLDNNNNTLEKSFNLFKPEVVKSNFQSRALERKMVELKKSFETYLKSYLVKILLQMQEQNNQQL